MQELAAYAGSDVDDVRRLVEMGFLEPDEGGRFSPGDVHRVRIIGAFRRSGTPLEALRSAERRGLVSFAYYDQLHPAPKPLSARTFGQLRDDLGDRGASLGALFRALSLAEPEPGSRLMQEDEELVLRLLEIVEATHAPDLGLRVARLLGEGLRRSTEAILGVYGEAVERAIGPTSGVPSEEVNQRYLAPWNRYAQIAPELGRWLTERHLSAAIDAFSVTTTERFLMDLGVVPQREESPPAIAFVDLTGFTRLAAERGDESAARLALEFGQLADALATDHAGRLVKLLGDGALLHFASPTEAIEATLELLARLPGEGLPMGHAGIAAGPVVIRDGDVFGRTVNLASRLSDRAEPDSILLSAEAAEASAPEGRFRLERHGREQLAGFPQSVEIFRVVAARRS